MGFSPTIKQDALVAAARHCCVCHRYKGLKIEIHHIEQEANGGANTIENAIALCFDCHTDAGHYNNDHPRGTKFSKPELKKARDEWHKIVQEHKIQGSTNSSDHLHFRYMILRDYETATEIFSGDLKEFPFPNTILLKNTILDFIAPFYTTNKHQYKVNSVLYKYFNTEEDIFNTYPDAELVDKTQMDYPYFKAVRIPKRDELLSIKEQLDPFIIYLLNNNIDPSEFSMAVIYENYGCGSGSIDGQHYIENIIFKSFWYSFLAITNISQIPVQLLELTGSEQSDPTILTNVFDKTGDTQFKIDFPKVAILPNQTVIVPTGLILVPFEEEPFNETIISDTWMKNSARSQVLTHLIRSVTESNYNFLGKYIKPKGIAYNANNRVNDSEMHDLDLNNLFAIDRYWHMGSCPHLFYKRTDFKMEYVKELFTKTPGREMLEKISVPKNVDKIIIAELEDEITFINEVIINKQVVSSNKILIKGQTLEFNVQPNDIITLKGYYVKEIENTREEDKIIFRNQIVRRFIRENTTPGMQVLKN